VDVVGLDWIHRRQTGSVGTCVIVCVCVKCAGPWTYRTAACMVVSYIVRYDTTEQ
jgi:hypothetical protein